MSTRTARRLPDPLAVGFLVAAAFWVAGVGLGYLHQPYDASLFYDYRLPDPYRQADYNSISGFYYSPPIAQLVYPFTFLPWPVFAMAMVSLSFVALVLLTGRAALLLSLIPFVHWELLGGNVNLVLALAVVVGFRWPATWAFVLLTKVTPGVGLLWFLVRREWRPLAIATGATLAIAAVSFALAPSLWPQWVESVAGNANVQLTNTTFAVTVPLLVRAPICVALVVWGALTNRRWTVVASSALALPVIWMNGLSFFVGVIPLLLADRIIAGKPIDPRLRRWLLPSPAVTILLGAGRAGRAPVAAAGRYANAGEATRPV
jgi:glycosyl transferase family 87